MLNPGVDGDKPSWKRWILGPSSTVTAVVGLALIVALNAGLLSILLPTVAPGFVHHHVRSRALHLIIDPSHDNCDSWSAMQDAERQHRVHGGDIYRTIFFERRVKFQYPPTALLLFKPAWDVRGLEVKAPTYRVLNWILFVFFWSTMAGAVTIFAISWRRSLGGPAPGLALGAAAVVALFQFPLLWAYWLGQTQAVINACMVLALLAWMFQRGWTAGVLVSIATLIKPQLGFLFLWGALRRRWSFVISGSVVLAIGLIASVLVYGIEDHLSYVDVVRFLGKRGEAPYMNQSINGMLNRLLGTADPVEFDFRGFPEYHPVVYFGTLGTSLAFILLCLFLPMGRGQKASPLDFATALVTAIIASPIAWEHHHGPVVAVHLLLFPMLIARFGARLAVLVPAGIVLVFTSQKLIGFEWLGKNVSVLFFDYLLVATLTTLVTLLWLRTQPAVAFEPSEEAKAETATPEGPPHLSTEPVANP